MAHYEASHFSVIVRLFYRRRHFLKRDFSSLELYIVYRLNTSDALWYPFSVDSMVL